MKLPYVIALVFTIGASSVWAQGGRPADPLYFGLKAGSVDVDDSGFDDASNAGVFVGYKLHEDASGTFFAEGEYTRTFNDGEVGGADWDIETLAAYAGYRTAGPWFLKAKAGFGWWDVNVDGLVTSAEADDTDFTYGVGGGYRFNNDSGLELEYNVIESDISSLMVGFFTTF